MKTKFTLLIAAGLLIASTSMAQGYDRHDNDKNDFHYERRDNFDYRAQMFNLQQQLNHELNELDRARECRDWEKVRHEKREIAEIKKEMRDLNYRRWNEQQDDFKRNHEYHDRY